MSTKKRATNDDIYNELQQIKIMLAARSHYDEQVEKTTALLDGNGHPSYKVIRDKVMQWNNKINAVIVVMVVDIIARLFRSIMAD